MTWEQHSVVARCPSTECEPLLALQSCTTLFSLTHNAWQHITLSQTSPELFGKLLLGDDISSARSTVLPAATKHASGNAAGAAGAPATRTQSAAIKPASSAARTTSMRQQGGSTGVPRSASAGRHGTMGMFDTPRGFGEEGMTEEQELAIELDSVKRERERLLEAIAHVKGSAGTLGAPVAAFDPCMNESGAIPSPVFAQVHTHAHVNACICTHTHVYMHPHTP